MRRLAKSSLGAASVLLALLVNGCGPGSGSAVVLYTSQDRVYAEPILRNLEQRTGLAVRTVFDNEAVKTVGLANRLLAERQRPQCDLFWSNEELRTRQLAARGVFEATGGWRTAGYRSRRLILNTNLLPVSQAPRWFKDLTNQTWRGKVAMAYPLFGTTATHFLALRQAWGPEAWETWCQALVANQPMVVDGNSVVATLVATGEAWIGMTDSDDIAAAQREGRPVVALPLAEDSLLIPSTVGWVQGAPHPGAARQLGERLIQPETLEDLVKAGALEGISLGDVKSMTLRPDWDALLADLDRGTARLKALFLR